MLPTKPMAISTIERHSGLSATQQEKWDTKEPSTRILSTDYRHGLFPRELHRTSHSNPGKLKAKLFHVGCPGRRRDASRLRMSRPNENLDQSRPITYPS